MIKRMGVVPFAAPVVGGLEGEGGELVVGDLVAGGRQIGSYAH